MSTVNLPHFEGLSFPVYELTPGSWQGPRVLGTWSPTSSAYRKKLGPAHSIALDFGRLGETAHWCRVISTAPGEFETSGAPQQIQVLTHAEPAAEKANDALRDVIAFQRMTSQMQSKREEGGIAASAAGAVRDATPVKTILVIDDVATEFSLVSVADAYAAAANLPNGSVTVCGTGTMPNITLQTVQDLRTYLPR